MKFKVLYLLAIIGLINFSANAQRGVRIGYIDTEYILQNVPEYQQAASQLDDKISSWKSEIEKRLSEVEQKKAALENEKVLLTKELYEERFEDITYEEAEIIDYQQKRFGPNGDMVLQRNQLIQPIQDQIFSAVQEIATNRKYDFVFDKSADVVMLYSAERYDISEQVLRTITRASNRQQAETKKERRALEDEDIVPEANEDQDERAKALEDKKEARQKELEALRTERENALEVRRKQQEEAREAKKKEADARRQKVLDARKKREDKVEELKEKSESLDKNTKVDSTKAQTAVKTDSTKVTKPKTRAEILQEKREKAAKDRAARVKELEDRKKKIEEDRKKAREEREAKIKKNDSIRKAKESKEGENNN